MNDLISTRVDKARALLLQARDSKDAKKVMDMAHAAEIYARRQKLSQESIDYAHGVKVDAMTLLGEFLERTPKNIGANGSRFTGDKREPVKDKTPTLADNGISKKESSLSQKLFKLSKSEPERHAMIRDAKTPISSAFSSAHVSNNSGENEWYTPIEYIDAARAVLGNFDLDPASSKVANEVVKARKFFTKEDDGLAKEWSGKVWMNPPYAGELIGQFTEKLTTSFLSGEVSFAIALVNNATETKWFQRIASEASAICFPSTRIKFWNPAKFTASPLQGQAVIFLGTSSLLFISEFRKFGLTCNVVRGQT